MNIILIGFMGSGKSTVAKRLGQLLGFATVEMDDLVYQKTHTRNMHEVFALGGELLLRETEIAIAKEYASKKHLILSTGGGVVLNKIILDYFKKTGGKVIFLHARFEQIVKQLEGDDSRPLFKDVTTAKKLYDFRLPLYLHYADEIIDVESQSAEEIALKIKDMVTNTGSSNGL
jgi:shikimate kinase